MRIAILAAGGLTKVMLEAVELEGQHEIIGLLDDSKKGSFAGYPIMGKCSQYKKICQKLDIEGLIIGFGFRFLSQRLNYYHSIVKDKTLSLVSAIHPQSIISPKAKLGQGVYVGPGVIINPGARIGDNSVIWSGSIIEHDNLIGKNVFITPGVKIAGYARLGENAFIGMGATIDKVNIGANVTVGASSLVLNNVSANQYVLGSPAKLIRKKKAIAYV